MTVIRESGECCTVIVTVGADPAVLSEMLEHARLGLSLFREQPGFISGALHRSTDGGRLVQYLQWQSEAAHLACMNDPRWDELPSTRRFMQFIHNGQATIDVRNYTVAATADA